MEPARQADLLARPAPGPFPAAELQAGPGGERFGIYAQIAKSRGARAARLRAIKDDIEANLSQEDLSVATLAARHRLPVRYVQRLFEEDGTTFTAFVLGRRLERAHRLLADPRFAHRPVSMIAFEVGFGHVPYFNESFRRRYDASPSDVRAQALRDN